MEVEIWVYRGIILFVVGLIIKLLQDKYSDQKTEINRLESKMDTINDTINNKLKESTDFTDAEHVAFDKSLQKLSAVVDKLSNTLDNQHTICKLQHDNIDSRFKAHNAKIEMQDTKLDRLEKIVQENNVQLQIVISKLNM